MSDQEPTEDPTRSYTVLTPGVAVSHYKIVEKLGEGGMGEVYLAEDSKLDRRVALKFLPTQLVQDDDLRARFTREAQAAARLDHPNIVTVYEVNEFEGRPYIAMQFVDGKTLGHYCRQEQLAPMEIVDLLTQVAAGLQRAHELGITHRDIKSANVMVDRERRAKLRDFGLAAVQGSDLLTRTGSTLGTLAYMSPEQAQGKEADERSDLFSLGVVAYELLTGATPFRRDNDAATVNALINEAPESLSRVKQEVPIELERIVLNCLAKRPEERYQSAAELCTELNALTQRPTGVAEQESPAIAVLPFANMSADPENEYFSDGLTEELLNVLAKNEELKVTGRTSSFAFKGKQEDLREIGRKLGVTTLLEGSVRKSGNRVRITAQLVNAADGFHLWSETYDRVLEDVFAIQDEIAAAVAREMHVTLLGKPSESKLKDPESYSLVLRGNHLMQQFSQQSCEKAIELYNRAIELDEENAKAWAGLSRSHLVSASFGYGDTQESYARSKEAVQRARELDELLPEVYEVQGWLFAAADQQFTKSLASFQRGLELAPNSSRMVSTLALIKALTGSISEGLSLASQAVELDPLNPEAYMNYAKTMLWAGKYNESREACLNALELSPDMSSICLTICWTHLLQGQLEEAREAIKKEPGAGYRLCGEAMVLHALGLKEESDRALEELLKQGDQWGYQFATVYGYRGDIDQAFEWLHKSAELRDAGTPITRVSPFFTSLHDDPRWPELLKRIGFEV